MRPCTFISSSVAFFSYFCMHAVIVSSCLGLALAGGSNETDRLALIEIKAKITNDPLGVMTSWNETTHFCHWHGVTCGRRHKRITILDLSSLKLKGSISPHVGNLSFLRWINLENNSFSHEIPQEIGRLRRLQYLELRNNSLSGEIPSNISGCSPLISFSLSNNFLVGTIPNELGTFSNLKYFLIDNNHFSGSIPHSFGNLSNLKMFSAVDNRLSGSIPNIFGRMTYLAHFSLGQNALSGVIPPTIFNLSSLEVFGVGYNNIQGTLPSNLGFAGPGLQVFAIGRNQFTGPIPVSISNASNLFALGIQRNQLHGPLPSLKNLHKLERFNIAKNYLGNGGIGDLSFLCDMTNATRLKFLVFSLNDLGGKLPQCTANLSSSLLHFYATENKISGSIPNGILENLANLEVLSLASNQFSGHIPPDVGKLSKLIILHMPWNSFSGSVPSIFGNLSQLTGLYLAENNLQGNIPSTLAECHNLNILSLGSNNFSGLISRQVIGLSSSYVRLDLSRNYLTGSLPNDVGNLINLEYLDVSHNMLFGEIPASLASCIKIEHLDMQGNFFHGAIPSTFESLRGLENLSLAHNNLSGIIPEFLEHFRLLQSLDLSYNNFEGAVPIIGVFGNASATSVQGNSKLCGGIPEFQLPKCKFRHSNKGGLSLTLKLVISLICGLSGVAFALSVLYLCCLRREKKEQASSDSETFPKMSYQSLLKATDGFSAANFIGMGSFGSVYKGLLDQGETTVAIKVINLIRRGASKSFIAECEVLKNIRHRNLVKVLSACSGVDHRGVDFKALIYEFMVNGSLEEWLHPAQTISETAERSRSLTFSQRLNIAIDTAMALDYLHHHSQVPIVHCDLKPSNVLLDDDVVGHVGDFGLARFLPTTPVNEFGNQSSSVGVKGTIGYAPPEYGMGHEVWTQGDVYSYGILLLEMFTGKRPTGDMFQGSSNLHNFVKAALPEQVMEIVDPVLVQENVGEITSNNRLDDSTRIRIKIEESLIAVLEIGVACSVQLPTARLDIAVAMAQMCKIRNKLRANEIFV